MSSIQSSGDLCSDIQRISSSNARSLQSLSQRLSLDELGGDEVRVGVCTDFINGDDIRVVERRRLEPPARGDIDVPDC